MGLPARGGPGRGSVGCSPLKRDKPMLLITSSHEKHKAEGFSRQGDFYPRNSNEEVSAICVASPTRTPVNHPDPHRY